MRKLYTLLLVFSAFTTFGQVQKGKYLTSGSFRFRNYYEGGNAHKRLVIGLTNKTGYFLSNSIVVGIKAGYTWTHEKVKRWGSIQTGGSQWYEKGIYNRHDYAIGVFADKYFKLAKRFYITAGIYGQYDTFSEVENGDLFDQNDVYVGVSYKITTHPNRVAGIGLTSSLVYFLNERFGINCLLSSLHATINKRRAVEFDFEAPLMTLGVQYHFPK